MTILVAGGAGYIGSHTVKELVREGFEVLVLDNFSSGRPELIGDVPRVRADLRDRESLGQVFKRTGIGAVLHFASLIQVGESYLDPRKYYTHNLETSLNLLDAMLEAGIKTFIFSSSAAVYGVPRQIPIPVFWSGVRFAVRLKPQGPRHAVSSMLVVTLPATSCPRTAKRNASNAPSGRAPAVSRRVIRSPPIFRRADLPRRCGENVG